MSKKVYCINCQHYGEFFDTCLIYRKIFNYVRGKQNKLKSYNPRMKNKNGSCKDYKLLKRLPQIKPKRKWWKFWE